MNSVISPPPHLQYSHLQKHLHCRFPICKYHSQCDNTPVTIKRPDMYEAGNPHWDIATQSNMFIIQLRNKEGFYLLRKCKRCANGIFLRLHSIFLLSCWPCTWLFTSVQSLNGWHAAYTSIQWPCIKIFLNRYHRRIDSMMRRPNLLVNYNVLLLCPQNGEHM